MREARIMLLATRLALPEETIIDLCELAGSSQIATCYKHYTQEFVNSVKKGHHVAYLVSHDGLNSN